MEFAVCMTFFHTASVTSTCSHPHPGYEAILVHAALKFEFKDVATLVKTCFVQTSACDTQTSDLLTCYLQGHDCFVGLRLS